MITWKHICTTAKVTHTPHSVPCRLLEYQWSCLPLKMVIVVFAETLEKYQHSTDLTKRFKT